MVYYELFPQNQILDADKYSSHLDWLKVIFDQKRPELANQRAVIFYQKNTRPYACLETRWKLAQFGWNMLLDPRYSPDHAPFGCKDVNFSKDENMKLRLRW